MRVAVRPEYIPAITSNEKGDPGVHELAGVDVKVDGIEEITGLWAEVEADADVDRVEIDA